jgi:hypothetical protein
VAARRAAAGREPIELGRGRLALDHQIGNRVGVLFVGVAVVADAAGEMDPGALLDDVRRLVRCGVEIGRRGERGRVAGRIGARAHRARRLPRRAADERADPGHVVSAERALDLIEVRQRLGAALQAELGRRVDIAALPDAGVTVGPLLHHHQVLGQGPLTGTVLQGRRAGARAIDPTASPGLALVTSAHASILLYPA